jgi:hypothetical protein
MQSCTNTLLPTLRVNCSKLTDVLLLILVNLNNNQSFQYGQFSSIFLCEWCRRWLFKENIQCIGLYVFPLHIAICNGLPQELNTMMKHQVCYECRLKCCDLIIIIHLEWHICSQVDIGFLPALRYLLPTLCMWTTVFRKCGFGRQACLICEERETTEFIRCPTKGCKAIYCPECWHDIHVSRSLTVNKF